MKTLNKIPEYWISIELGKICNKAIKVKRKEMSTNEKLLYLDIGGIDNQTNKIINHKIFTWGNAPSRAQQIVKQGDVLFSTVRTYLKNIAQITKPEYNNHICSSGFTVIRGCENIAYAKYLFAISLYEGFIQSLNEMQTGSSYPAVRDSDVFNQIIPLPPLPEQRAIVSKIEQLFSELDHGIANLKAAKDKLEIYRQAVLKKAFEGELTKEWREKNNLDNWSILKISEIGEIVTGNTPSKKNVDYYSSQEYNFYKPTDLEAGHNVINSIDGLSLVGFKVGRQVSVNSILVTCIGATIGKTGLIKKEGCFNQQINAIIPFTEFDPEYIYYQALGISFQTQIKAKASATTLPILNKGKFSTLTMQVCSKEEQIQIVQEIETRLSVCDNILTNIEDGLQKAEALRQSILKKAFEGKLLSDDELKACRREPDWEPAEELLKRIKNEKKAKT